MGKNRGFGFKNRSSPIVCNFGCDRLAFYCLSEISENQLSIQETNNRQRERVNDKSKYIICSLPFRLCEVATVVVETTLLLLSNLKTFYCNQLRIE